MMVENAQYYTPIGFPAPAWVRCDINGVTSFVPIDEANVDYTNIMALVKDNKLTIAPADEPQANTGS
jgi:hypothetical protein